MGLKKPREKYVKEDQLMLNVAKRFWEVIVTCFSHKC